MTLFIIWLIRVLVILIVVRLVLRWIHNYQLAARRSTAGQARAERAGGVLVRDPQCGTYVPKSRAVVAGHGAHAMYFCSTKCRDTYEHRSAAS